MYSLNLCLFVLDIEEKTNKMKMKNVFQEPGEPDHPKPKPETSGSS